jgi:hypothetical protein
MWWIRPFFHPPAQTSQSNEILSCLVLEKDTNLVNDDGAMGSLHFTPLSDFLQTLTFLIQQHHPGFPRLSLSLEPVWIFFPHGNATCVLESPAQNHEPNRLASILSRLVIVAGPSFVTQLITSFADVCLHALVTTNAMEHTLN